MPREIKFRAWYKAIEQICQVIAVDFQSNQIIICAESEGEASGWLNFDEIELMQYAGLKDKNDAEIYEGDIIRINNSFNIAAEWDYQKLANLASCVKVAETNKYCSVEVIGNIYENPDLLPKEL